MNDFENLKYDDKFYSVKNEKIIDKVTITGIDNKVKFSLLKEFSQKYPWVEWGILISESRAGTSRYPSFHRINDILDLNLNFSIHICGKLMRDICNGCWRISTLINFLKVSRIQINLGSYIDKFDRNKFINGIKCMDIPWQIIIQTKNVNCDLVLSLSEICNVLPLFDISGGKGIKPVKWPVEFKLNGCGFAGGLTPENVGKELEKISLNIPDFVWIDVESGIRSGDKMDFNKIEKFLEKVKPWIKEE